MDDTPEQTMRMTVADQVAAYRDIERRRQREEQAGQSPPKGIDWKAALGLDARRKP